MNRPTLAGRGVVVSGADRPAGAAIARNLAAAGAAVVCTGSDAGALGELVRVLHADGSRAAVYVGDPAAPALVEMLAELFEPPD